MLSAVKEIKDSMIETGLGGGDLLLYKRDGRKGLTQRRWHVSWAQKGEKHPVMMAHRAP